MIGAFQLARYADRRVSVTGYSGAFGSFGESDVATVTYSQPAPVSVLADGPAALRAPSGRLQLWYHGNSVTTGHAICYAENALE